MTTLAILSFIFGAALGMRFKVLVLAPSIGFAVFCVISLGIASGNGVGLIALGTIATIIGVQIGYLFGTVTRFVVASTRTAQLGGVFRPPLPVPGNLAPAGPDSKTAANVGDR